MPAYKDENKNTWFCSFKYIDWDGVSKRKLKRGFALRKEALDWERKFLSKSNMSCSMTFEALTELYFEDISARLKSTTIANKEHLFRTKLLPFFGKLPIDKITPAHVRKWQNDLIGSDKDYAPTYLKATHNQLSAVFNFAVRYYNLPLNPCRIAGSMGKKDADEMQIWTVEQFKHAMACCNHDSDRLAFEIMFYGGLRIGEVLALTPSDVLESKIISITKSYARLHGQDIISSPKTPKSIRDVTIPTFLYDHIQSYISSLYDITPDIRIFNYGKGTLNRVLKTCAVNAGLPIIRVHDLRHPYVKPTLKIFKPMSHFISWAFNKCAS